MAKDTFREKLARIQSLREVDDSDLLVAGLRQALRERHPHAVCKAAAIAGSRYVTDVVPDLVATYERLFSNAPKIDPLALGKQTIAQALKDLDHSDPAVFVRGLGHVQLEAAWGEPVDVAGGLRATCAHALVGCDMDVETRLGLLVDHLVDDNIRVRIEVVRAIAQNGGYESALLLRLKALAGDTEAEVFGACFDALLGLEQCKAVEFIARFLQHNNREIAVEAASALAASRVREAAIVVRRLWHGPIALDMRRAIVLSSGACALTEAAEFLLEVIGDRRAELAVAALSALAASRFRRDMRERARVAAEATGNAEVISAYRAEYSPELRADAT